MAHIKYIGIAINQSASGNSQHFYYKGHFQFELYYRKAIRLGRLNYDNHTLQF